MSKVNHPKTRRFKLCVDKVETLEDVKKILNAMNIRIDTDNPEWENVEDYFCLEVVPKGYFRLVDKIGWEGIAKLHYHEIEQQAKDLLQGSEIPKEEFEVPYGLEIEEKSNSFPQELENNEKES